MKGSAIVWLVLYGLALFSLGFMVHKLVSDPSEEAPPSYLEELTRTLRLSKDQQGSIRELLHEEDRRIREVLEDTKGRAILQGIRDIRSDISSRVTELLDEDQKRLYKAPAAEIPAKEPVK